MCPHDSMCPMTKQAKESLTVIRSVANKQREVILSQYSSAGLLSTREKWSQRRGLSEGLQKGLRDWSTFHRKTESWICLAWRRVGGGSSWRSVPNSILQGSNTGTITI